MDFKLIEDNLKLIDDEKTNTDLICNGHRNDYSINVYESCEC